MSNVFDVATLPAMAMGYLETLLGAMAEGSLLFPWCKAVPTSDVRCLINPSIPVLKPLLSQLAKLWHTSLWKLGVLEREQLVSIHILRDGVLVSCS